MQRQHWFGEDVDTLETTLADLRSALPVFERRGFGANRFRDVIVRTGDTPMPVATVSKSYVLIQHADAADAVIEQVANAGIDPAAVPVHLEITEYGTRMALRATLPDEHTIRPDDGHPMALTFECFNSVDKTVPLFAAVGWFRFVCSNGLVVGTTTARVRQRHVPPLKMDEISEVLAEGMASALGDAKSFAAWRSTSISRQRLAAWVDGPVAAEWGPWAAARVYAISRRGEDGTPALPVPKGSPHRWPLRDLVDVPGAEPPGDHGYAIAQALAWVAKQRNDVAERLKWRAGIRPLMAQLIPA
jgi:hypothetical protein